MKTHDENPRRHATRAGTSHLTKPEENPEIRFLTKMIDHHAMAVDMSEALASEEVHPEVKQLCRKIVTAQRAEIEQMQRWLREWHGLKPEAKA